VQQHDGPSRELGFPSFEIVLNVLIKMPAIDVQNVNRPILKRGDGLVKSGPHQLRKIAVVTVVMVVNVLKNLVTIKAAVLVTFQVSTPKLRVFIPSRLIA
jgi:hypothetical protein